MKWFALGLVALAASSCGILAPPVEVVGFCTVTLTRGGEVLQPPYRIETNTPVGVDGQGWRQTVWTTETTPSGEVHGWYPVQGPENR